MNFWTICQVIGHCVGIERMEMLTFFMLAFNEGGYQLVGAVFECPAVSRIAGAP